MSSASPFRNLPPEVVRELKRHISPKPLPKYNPTAGGPSSNNINNNKGKGAGGSIRSSLSGTGGYVLFGAVGLICVSSTFPLLAKWWIGRNIHASDKPLSAAQNRRGVFMNSGSRDVGPDPKWDFEKGQYIKDADYYAFFDEERNRRILSSSFYSLPPKVLEKTQKEREEFAKGLSKPQHDKQQLEKKDEEK